MEESFQDLDLLRCKAGLGGKDDWPVKRIVSKVLKPVLNT